jgi:hypothetical protein
MSDSTTTTIEPETQKATVAERKAAADAAFVVGNDPTAIAALFAVVPNGREYVDVVYNGRVATLSAAILADPSKAATFADDLAPLAGLRSAVVDAMPTSTQKTERVIDPAEKRAADVEKFGTLSAIATYLRDSAAYVNLTNVEPDDLTDDEKAIVTAATVPAKVIDHVQKVEKVIDAINSEKSVRGRESVAHTDPAEGTILTRGGKGVGPSVASMRDANGKTYYAMRRDDGTLETFTSISAAATAVNGGGSLNGWKFFGLA